MPSQIFSYQRKHIFNRLKLCLCFIRRGNKEITVIALFSFHFQSSQPSSHFPRELPLCNKFFIKVCHHIFMPFKVYTF